MVLKPSEVVPFSGVILAEILAAAGVPPGVFNLVNGDGPGVGAAISAHPDIDLVSFTGSTRAGVEVARSAATTVKRVHQELGGKSPNILLEDADMQRAVSGGVKHVMQNSGQSCNAPTRMLAPNRQMAEVVAVARATAEATTVGDPNGNSEIGPVTSRDATIRRLSAFAACQVKAAAEPDDDDALAAFRHLVADLQGRLARETDRREHLEQRVAEAVEAGQLCERRAKEAEAQRAAVPRELAALERRQDASDAATAPGLPAQRILYVGGQPGCTKQMRTSLEAAGGALLCHDGGRHDHPSMLPGLISQADRVAFPVDCVSHDAALTVKRLCRQLGKPWVPLRSSGLGSFLAGLAEPSGGHAPCPS